MFELFMNEPLSQIFQKIKIFRVVYGDEVEPSRCLDIVSNIKGNFSEITLFEIIYFQTSISRDIIRKPYVFL